MAFSAAQRAWLVFRIVVRDLHHALHASHVEDDEEPPRAGGLCGFESGMRCARAAI